MPSLKHKIKGKKQTEIDYEIERITHEIEAASDLKDPKSKALLARTLAEQIARHRALTERDLRGELPGDVARTMPAVSRQIRDLSRELGITARAKASGGFWDASTASDGPATAPEAPEAPAAAPRPTKRGPGRPRKTARLEAVEPVGEDETEDEG